MRLKTIADCEHALGSLVYNSRRDSGGHFTVERTKRLAAMAGNPQEHLHVVHIAGTSGKTSTSYYVDAFLRSSGAKTGLTVSPHITDVRDRAQINGRPLAEEKYVAYFNTFWSLIDVAKERPSYFEFMLVFALWVFAQERVDYAVVETGLGGLHDSSNICTRPDKVCVLTDIGLDHQDILGHTLGEIAQQKAGIIWPGNEVFLYGQAEEIMRAVRDQAEKVSAQIHVVAQPTIDTRSDVPAFQQRNWLLARAAYECVAQRDGLPASELDITQQASVPARMEECVVQGKQIVIDGAHNEQKMHTFFESFAMKYGDIKPVVLLSLKAGKDLESVGQIIARYASSVIITEFSKEQDMPFGAQSADAIASTLKKLGLQVYVHNDTKKAYDGFIASTSNVGVVVGSLYLASEIRVLLQDQEKSQQNKLQ